MKRGFTLIELIFVIVIIGVLASFAIPKFTNLTTHAKSAGIKSLVTSVQSAVDNIHGKWIVNDNYSWIGADGVDHSADFNSSSGYPAKLDGGAGSENLFSYVLKIPVPDCGSRQSGCWKEYEDNKYEYYYSPTKILKIEYNSSNGTLECVDGTDVSRSECEKIIY
ncbi:type II secretion system protein [Nautilia sp.]